jgi:hypothetical protein
MVDYVFTGITETDDFRVYTGTTPFNTTFYDTYSGGTSFIIIYNLPNNYSFFVTLESVISGFRSTRFIKTDSAYCGDICDGVFALSVTYPVTPTPSVTPTITPTKSLTPSITVSPSPSQTEKVKLSATPTQTPTISLSPTKSLTPTPTPTATQSFNCGYYQITLNVDVFDGTLSQVPLPMFFTYTNCRGEDEVRIVENHDSFYDCILEENSIPIINIPNSYVIFVTINRISFC